MRPREAALRRVRVSCRRKRGHANWECVVREEPTQIQRDVVGIFVQQGISHQTTGHPMRLAPEC